MKKRKCNQCGKLKKHRAKGLCHSCYVNANQFSFTLLGHISNIKLGGLKNRVNKEEVKTYYQKEKERILQDCIKNPAKYLE
jgi:hypothetical protein